MIATKKLYPLDGLRGIAAMSVVIMHLCYTYAVDYDTRLEQWSMSGGIFNEMITSTILALTNGTFSVWLFWMMSGSVLSIKFFQLKEKDRLSYIRKSAAKRYFRLLIPVASSIFLAYFCMSNGLYSNKELAIEFGEIYVSGPISWLNSQWSFEPELESALSSSFWYTFFNYRPQSTYNSVLWTMGPELISSYFLFMVLPLLGDGKNRLFTYLGVFSFCFFFEHFYVLSFIAGALIIDIQRSFKFKSIHKSLYIILIPLIIYALSKPNYGGYYYIIVSFVLVFLIVNFGLFNSILSSKLPSFLGKISFSLYLTHMMMIGLVASPTYFLSVKFISENNSKLFSAICVLISSIVFSFLFYKSIEKASSRQAGEIVEKIDIYYSKLVFFVRENSKKNEKNSA